MSGKDSSAPTEAEVPSAAGNPYLAAGLAWVFPGAGHLHQRRWTRGLLFLALVLLALGIGTSLDGRLPFTFEGSPLQTLATLGAMGSGLPYFFLRFAVGYQGTVEAVGYDYGSAFILTAGLMNLLLVLDAWDIAWGKKA